MNPYLAFAFGAFTLLITLAVATGVALAREEISRRRDNAAEEALTKHFLAAMRQANPSNVRVLPQGGGDD
jgi:triphosphoribosyl-dephospho-CoA synthetase